MNSFEKTLKKAKKTIKHRKLFNKKSYLMLMVSGGSDSVALCYLIMTCGIVNKNFAIMHLDHKLRDNSSEDAKFVKNLADWLDIPFYCFSEDVKEAAKEDKNIEAAGHRLRYEYAHKACKKWADDKDIDISAIKICTAHTGDDRIENFYMRSIVGTGPGGFAGINYKNEDVVRPLLDFSKEELRQFIDDLPRAYEDNKGCRWVEDQTNFDTDRFRAYVRHEIIPLAKKQNPKVMDNLINSMNLIADEADYLEKQVNEVMDKYIEFEDKKFIIKPGFSDEDIVLKRRAVYNALRKVLNKGVRLETKTINSVLESTETSNYTDNIQENYSVHSNKKGVLVQPMKDYRKSRKRI